MKRYANLYQQVISIDNLKLADLNARKGKSNNYGVKLHDRNREGNIQQLHQALKEKTFHTSDYTVFSVYEPKERLIFRLPYYPDRIVHHAVMNVLEPIWYKTFPYNTYSCIKGRGIEGCARQVDKIINEYHNSEHLYCLKIDIRKYYPSISHNVIKQIVRRKIKDKDLLWLLDDIIDSADGLPIGNYISQYLANLYLAYFMHYCNEVLPIEIQQILQLSEKPHIPITEYADDIVFFSESKKILKEVFVVIRKYIEEELKLQIKPNWQIFPISDNRQDRHGRALDYVGYKFYRKQKLLRKSIKKNFCKKVHSLCKRKKALTATAYKQAVAPWLGWCQHSNSRHLLKKLIKSDLYESIVRH